MRIANGVKEDAPHVNNPQRMKTLEATLAQIE